MISANPVAGEPLEGHTDVMGKPYHGHAGVVSSGHRASHRGAAHEEALRPHKASHLSYHDEKHSGPCRLPAHCSLCHIICWYVIGY